MQRAEQLDLMLPRMTLIETPGSHWLTPPLVYESLNQEFGFDFDPCPYPPNRAENALTGPWGNVNFVNPPFRKKDGFDGAGPTAFVHKAIAEQAEGRTSVLLLPVQSYVNLLLEAGAELRSMGRIRWLDVVTGEPMQSPSPIACFILRPHTQNGNDHTQGEPRPE